MTNPNSAAQAAQEAERNAAAESYFDARPSLDTVEGRRIYEAGFDRAYTLMSKLRAPVADERVGPRHPVVIKWRNNGIEACAGIADAYGMDQAAIDMRAMLTKGIEDESNSTLVGNAPTNTACDGRGVFHGLRSDGVSGVANVVDGFPSAPVAGEAQPFMYGIMGPDGKAHFEEFCVSGDHSELQAEVVDHLNRDNPEDCPFSVVALFRDAAPKASAEDECKVRADAFIAGFICAGGDAEEAKRQAPQFQACVDAGRKHQPQADKDGGQQREGVVTDDMRYAVRFAPSSAHWSERLMEFFGPDAREGIDSLEKQLREARTALSATQAEQGERDE